jgi:hypothetical protein
MLRGHDFEEVQKQAEKIYLECHGAQLDFNEREKFVAIYLVHPWSFTFSVGVYFLPIVALLWMYRA